MAKFGINDILNAKTKAAGQQAQGYKEIYLSPYEVKAAEENTHQKLEGIEELADSFLHVGQEQPTVLARVNGEYRIIDGHRRNEANKLNLERGHKEYEKVLFRSKDMSEAMGFKFYRDRTTIRKSILQGIRGKVNRVKRKEKITWVDAGSLLSRLGWIWHSDTYAYYERYIKPYVKVKVLKTLVSKHARKENERNGMVRSRKHHRRETKRAGYNKQPAPCI